MEPCLHHPPGTVLQLIYFSTAINFYESRIFERACGDLKCITWTSCAGEHYFHFTLAHIEHFTMSLAVINIKDYLEPYSRTPSRVLSPKTIWTHISDANRKLGAKGHGVSLALSFPHAPRINTGTINYASSLMFVTLGKRPVTMIGSWGERVTIVCYHHGVSDWGKSLMGRGSNMKHIQMLFRLSRMELWISIFRWKSLINDGIGM